jgi:hypothetical protein
MQTVDVHQLERDKGRACAAQRNANSTVCNMHLTSDKLLPLMLLLLLLLLSCLLSVGDHKP